MKSSDLGGQVVLSLSRIKAFIVGFLEEVVEGFEEVVDDGDVELWRASSRGRGRSRRVGIVRCGRRAVGLERSVETVRRKAARLRFGIAMGG